jgi:NAD(P)H-nitrite reductase large subunit
MTCYVIIGGSAGAVGGVEGIRKLDPKGGITVVTEESMTPYSRPAIGECLDGRVDLESLRFGSPDFWNEYSVQVLSGRRVTSIDLGDNTLKLDDGQVLGFDKLLLATGTRPFIPKMEGMDREGFCTFMNTNDVQRIRQELLRTQSAIVIGGGLIGVEAAEALVNLGVDVTVVELRGWLLNLLLDREAARIVESAMESRGVKLITGQSVKEILGREGNERRVGGVVLSGGAHIECDLVISAVGVIPRTELAVQAGLKVNRGILVDKFMQTSVPGVYACGDVAEAYEVLGGTQRVFAIWPLARLGGRVAGENMAGGRVEYQGGVAMSALRYFGVPIISVGLDAQETTKEFEVLIERAGGSYRKIILRENRVVGFTLVRCIESAGLIYNLVRTQTDVSGFKGKLLSPEFSFAHLPERIRKRTLMEAWT